MKNRTPALGAALLLCIAAGVLGLPGSASAGPALSASAVSKPRPSPSPSPGPSGMFVKAYAAIINGSMLDLSPLGVQATADGGSIALAETESSQGLGVDWLIKLSASGTPQWQEQVGCSIGAPGDYAGRVGEADR